MRLVKDAEIFMTTAPDFYQASETRWHSSFYYPTPIHHNLADHAEANLWYEKSTLPLFNHLLGEIRSERSELLPAPFGYGVLHSCGWLNTPQFLAAHKKIHTEYGNLIPEKVSLQDLDELSSDYDGIIICSGHLMREMFTDLDLFRPTRGEVLTIKSSALPEDAIIHGKIFIMPLGHQLFKVGASYHWDDLRDVTTEEGLLELKNGLESLFKGSYEIIDHQAGVRPNVRDRKPLLGSFYGEKYFSFNGMGSRAVLMTPHLADILLNHILEDAKIPELYDISRFLK